MTFDECRSINFCFYRIKGVDRVFCSFKMSFSLQLRIPLRLNLTYRYEAYTAMLSCFFAYCLLYDLQFVVVWLGYQPSYDHDAHLWLRMLRHFLS